MKMKKYFLIALILIAGSGLFAAGKRIAVFDTAAEGLSQDESNWIPSSVRRRFEANFNDYTTYTLVDVHNEDAIKQLHKKAENFAYDQETSIEIGKLVSAEIGIFTSITKANGRYILSANVTNLTTGIRLSSVTTDSVTEPVSLFDGAGSSANKAFVKVCSDLGINLSSIELYVLLKGEDLNEKDQIAMTTEEVSRYEKKQKELEKQLKEVSLSADLDAETRRAKLEAEKTLAEQQKQIAAERLERLKLQQQRLLQDQEQQKQRTAAQREKIEAAAAKAEQQAKLVRQQKIDSLSVDQQIAVIEAKKQALYDIHNSVVEQEKIIKQNANEDYKNQCLAIDNEPLRNGEMDSNGNMLAGVKQMRNDRKLEIKKELEAKALKDIANIRGTTDEQEASLYNDIQNDLKKLSQRRTISSLQDDRILNIGNYAGDLYEWDTTVSLYINDVKIFGQKANIGYESVSGKAPVNPGASTDKWNDYLDTVDLYDYMFRRNVPAISLEVDYSIEAMSDYYPSMYKMTLYEFRFIDTVSGKTVQIVRPAKSSYRFSVSPAVDISFYKGGAAANKATDSDEYTSQSSVSKTETVKTGKDVKKRKSAKNPMFDQKNGGGARFNMGINLGLNNFDFEELDNQTALLEGYMSIPFSSHMFSQVDLGFLTVPEVFSGYYSNGAVMFTTFDLGFNFRLGRGSTPPDLYFLGGIGIAFDEELIGIDSREEESLLLYKYAVGLDIQLTEFVCVTVEWGVIGSQALGNTNLWKVGAAFTLPNFIPF